MRVKGRVVELVELPSIRTGTETGVEVQLICIRSNVRMPRVIIISLGSRGVSAYVTR